jgi:hypothetical protein
VKVIASDFSSPELFAVKKNSCEVHARQKTTVLRAILSNLECLTNPAKGPPKRNAMARSSATTKAARRAVALLVLLSSSTARGEDSHSCNLYLVNYMNSTLSLSLYDGRPDSCSSEPGFFYEVKPPVDGKAGALLASGRGVPVGASALDEQPIYKPADTHHMVIEKTTRPVGAAEVFSQCEDPYECSVQLGDDGAVPCTFQVGCDNTVVFYPDASGALQYCFNQGGNCHVPPASASTTNQAEQSTRALLRGGDR